MKLLKLLCLKCRRSKSRSKACESDITKLLPAWVHEITLSVAGSETMSYTLVRNGGTSGGLGTAPTGAVPFPVEAPTSLDASFKPAAREAEAAPEGGGDAFLEPIDVRGGGNPSLARGFEIGAATRRGETIPEARRRCICEEILVWIQMILGV